MKKTLAAVLAAMMALSTATVALAADKDVSGSVDSTKGGYTVLAPATDPTDVEFDKKSEFALNVNGYVGWLGEALSKGQIKIDVTVTEGRSLLTAAPTVKALKGADGMTYAVLSFKPKHTYGLEYNDVDSAKDTRADITMRVRVTCIAKDGFAYVSPVDSTVKWEMAKGDTLSVDELPFEVGYHELAAFGKDMTITATERNNNETILDASVLLNELAARDTETATFYFDETAAFTAKISDAQKNVNVYYSTAVADDYYEEYPEVAFEAIEFKGSPKFLRKGTLTFNAIGDEDTAVYEVTADGLVELEIAEYDSTYDVVTVEGISKLTSYLVASEALEVEAEVEVEEPAVEEENPNTGAC